MKFLFLDIETSPNTAFVWSLWKETIPLDRLIESSEVLCWSAKWLGSEEVMFDSIYKSRPIDMLRGIHKLMDEADAIIHYNGLRFDIPCLNKEFLIYGMTPPAPYKNIDLYRTVKGQFKFTSNKLKHVLERLGLENKIDTTFQLWVDCMNRVPEAWKYMEEYNKNDVIVLEKLYHILRPWVTNHPNRSLYTERSGIMCPVCGSTHYQSRGSYYTTVGKYKRYQCNSCGKWFRGRDNMSYRQVLSV